ncbi:MAG: Na+/H+ antiporter NhaC family protein [Myxococcota bacterium]
MAVSVALLTVCFAAIPTKVSAQEVTAEVPELLLSGVQHKLALEGPVEAGLAYRVVAFGEPVAEGVLDQGASKLPVTFPKSGHSTVEVTLGSSVSEHSVRFIPGFLAILPALFAIVLAVATRRVVVALLSGVWLGAVFFYDYGILTGLLRTVDTYIVGALSDPGNATIVVFSLLLGGMIGVITRSGGGAGMAKVVTTRVRATRGGLLGTWLMGFAVFFDDYANALLVGSTMRPITDRLRVSREKLAFVVDGTSAPVSSLAIVSSWIGVEVGYIKVQFERLEIEQDAYWVFLQTLPYRFYPILMLFFGLLIIVLRRDFGPMLKAERRARGGQLLAEGAKPASDFDASEAEKAKRPSWINAVFPIGVVIVVATVAMVVTGIEGARAEGVANPGLRDIFSNAASSKALLWAAFFGGVGAIAVAVGRRSLKFNEAMEAWLGGIRSMLLAAMILVLAWSIGDVCDQLHTGDFLIGLIGDSLHPGVLPALVFLVAALVAFATGTSWGTMAILFPLVVPLAHDLAPNDQGILLGAISSILAGSVWGDHCSPISDTTILSSMASSCDHIDHVRTQLPYALLVGVVSLVMGDLLSGLGLYPGWLGLLFGAVILALVVRFVGKPVDDYAPSE